MNYFELTSLIKWLNAIGITTVKQLAHAKEKFDLSTNNKMLNFAHGCFVYDITFDNL